MGKKNNRGGTRKNAGAKPQYKEKTTTIAFRVPISQKESITKLVRKELEMFKIKSK